MLTFSANWHNLPTRHKLEENFVHHHCLMRRQYRGSNRNKPRDRSVYFFAYANFRNLTCGQIFGRITVAADLPESEIGQFEILY